MTDEEIGKQCSFGSRDFLLLVLVVAASNASNRVKQYICAFSIIFFTIKFELIVVDVNATLQVGHCFLVFIDSSRQLRQNP